MPGGTVAADPDTVPGAGPQVGFEAGELRLPVRPKALGYVRLSKARVYHYIYGWALGALLLRTDGGADAGTVPGLVLVLAGTLAAQWSASAADDVSGFLDGSDARNYAGRPAVTVVRKPLVTGALTVPEARRFAVVTWSAGMAAIVLAAAVMPGPVPWPALVVGLVTPALGIQYSWGAKLSYRPLGLEATIFLTGVYTVVMPYWLAVGTVSRELLLVAALFGLWLLMVVCYGNASDRDGDRAVGRRTLAVLLPPRWFTALLHLLVLANLGLTVLLFTTAHRNPALIVLAVPVFLLHLAQLYFGTYRGQLRTARFLVLLSIDVGVFGLAAALLLDRT